MIEKYTFGPIKHGLGTTFARADLEIYSINTFRPSYTALVFFNDDEVDEKTCSEERESYAGRFGIFGHAQCVGDDGHCDIPPTRRRFDDRPSHPLTPAYRRVVVTEPLRRAVEKRKNLKITIIAGCDADEYEGSRLLDCGGMQLVTFA